VERKKEKAERMTLERRRIKKREREITVRAKNDRGVIFPSAQN
jgi:hypothetical protein